MPDRDEAGRMPWWFPEGSFGKFGPILIVCVVLLFLVRFITSEQRDMRERQYDEAAASRAEAAEYRKELREIGVQVTKLTFELKLAVDALQRAGLKLERAVEKEEGRIAPPRIKGSAERFPGGEEFPCGIRP